MNFIDTTIGNLKQHGIRLVIGAIVATVLLELMMQIGAPKILGIAPMNPANMITNILGLPQGHTIGVVSHFSLGLFAFPIGYMAIAFRYFPGGYLSRGALWGVLLWLVAMAVTSPLAGMHFFLGFGMPMMAALVAHIVYGIILATIVGKAT